MIHERAIRPNDVPGRLLNMALLNIGNSDPGLRLAAYNLLYSLSLSFKFNVGNQLLNAKGMCDKLSIKRRTLFTTLRSLYSFKQYKLYCGNQ